VRIISKKPLSAAILSNLEQRIEGEEWKPGHKLPSLSSLAREYGAGVSTLREALRILENRGYLLIEQGRGMFVRSPSHWRRDDSPDIGNLQEGSLVSLLEFRELLEPEIAALAAERGSPGQIVNIKAAAAMMIENLADGEDYFTADLAFHAHIAEASANEVMQSVLQGISDLMLESRRQTMRIPGSAQRASHFHMLIALAIEQRNPGLARETMKLHLKDVREDLQRVKESLKANGR
jgi:GntR family transcriptional repressor for pyruvate dehydrogenase complex